MSINIVYIARIFRFAALPLLLIGCSHSPQNRHLLNVSYDPTRELYQEVNKAFIVDWKQKTGETIEVDQSHGGSAKQARSVIDGLQADVVTLGLAYDIDAIVDKAHSIDPGWRKRLPDDSTPYTSTIVFLVRQGNPKGIHDWPDVVRKDVTVITPNPKTSGGARWNYLAAWGYAWNQSNHDETKARDFIASLYHNVPVLDSGARGATTTFVQRGLGDVLLTWENEAYLSLKEFGDGKFEIVNPSSSILAEPPVAVVDANVDRHGTRQLAEAYLKFLYTGAAQEIAARHFYRTKHQSQLPDIQLFKIGAVAGTWSEAQAKHFADHGLFDQLYKPQGE